MLLCHLDGSDEPKLDDSDELQLCAQAMFLEEMLLCEIPEAFLYYGEAKRRLKTVLDEGLREKVKTITKEMHELLVYLTT